MTARSRGALFALGALALAVFVAAQEASLTPPRSISAAAARKSFDVFWAAFAAEGGEAERWSGLVSAGPTASRRVSGLELRDRLADSLGPEERRAPPLFGQWADLDRGFCWELSFDGKLRAGLAACVGAADGRVRAVWVVPEG